MAGLSFRTMTKKNSRLTKSPRAASIKLSRTFAGFLLPSILLLASLSDRSQAADEAQQAGDARRGKTFFQQSCAICHATSLGINNTIISGQGPSLVGVLGQHAGSGSNFNYTKALAQSGI